MIVAFLVFLPLLIKSFSKNIQIIVKKSDVQVRKISLGAWTEGFFDAKNKELHPEVLQDFESLINKKVSIAHYYLGWEMLSNPELIGQFEIINSNGWTPMLNVNPYYFDGCPATSLPLYRAISEGLCDEFLHLAGNNLSSINKPFYLVFAWEMNNDNNHWSIPYTGSTTEHFVAAWQHIYSILKEEKASNVTWVFCPNIPEEKTSPYDKIYPGSDYVDWVCLDGYNWGTTQSWSQWVDFAGVFTSAYNRITTIASDKPLMIGEVNTTNKGGDKANWYRDMFINQIPNNFPKIEAVIIFNEDKTIQEKVNWKVDVTPDSLQAFIEGVNSGFYK